MYISRLIIVGTLFFGGYANANMADDFEQMSPQQALDYANKIYHTNEGGIQVFPDRIVGKFKDGSEGYIKLKDKFLVSIAPYINKTHPCEMHVATDCTGEFSNVTMNVSVYDKSNRKMLIYKLMKTNKNGFIDLWLPRDRDDLGVKISYGKYSAETTIKTKDDSNTCITNMKFS